MTFCGAGLQPCGLCVHHGTVIASSFEPALDPHAFVARTQAGFDAALDTDVSTLLVAHGGSLYVLVFSLGADLLEQHIANATPLLFEYEAQADCWRISNIAPSFVTAGYRRTAD